MKNTWKYHGRLNNGEAVFVRESGEIAVEKDQRYLVDATPAELFEVFQSWPELIDEVTREKPYLPVWRRDDPAELKDQILTLERVAVVSRSRIEKMGFDIEERDKMISALRGGDIVGELKDRIISLEFEAQERQSVIVALKYANDERDKMIASLMKDVAAGKAKVKDLIRQIGWLTAKGD